jgi:putative hydrolase of the HAD superfamily
MQKAVLFDMGNTLLRYSRPEQESWQQTETRGLFAAYRLLEAQNSAPPVSCERFAEHCFEQLAAGWVAAAEGRANLRTSDWLASCCAALGRQLDAAQTNAAVAAYTAPLRANVEPLPGAVSTLAYLKRSGYRLGLISNTAWPGSIHRADLAAAGLLPWLNTTIFSGDAGIWKPNPAIFRTMLATLDCQPEQALFVGDNPREDILGAQQIGLRAIWMHTVEFPLGDIRPHAEIHTLPELLNYL